MTVYILVDVSSKQSEALHATDDRVKAEHWKELLNEQGKDAKVFTLNNDIVESIVRLTEDCK